MKKLAILLSLLFAHSAFAADVLLGAVATGASLTLPRQARISVQCAASAYVVIGKATGTTYSASDGIKVSADALLDTNTTNTFYTVWIFQDSGATTCKVFRVD
jgi:hypothetical protein